MTGSRTIRMLDHQLTIVQRIADGGIIGFAMPLSYWLYYRNLNLDDRYITTTIAAILFFYVCSRINNLYLSPHVYSSVEEIRPLLLSWFGALTGLLAFGYALKSTHELSRVTLAVWAIITPVAMLVWRNVYRKILSVFHARGYYSSSAVIVGLGGSAKGLAENILNSPWMGLSLVGFISADGGQESMCLSGKTCSVLGGLDDLFRLARNSEIDVVYVAIPTSEQNTIETIMRGLGDSTVSIFVVPDFFTADIMQGSWVAVGDTPTVSIIDAPAQGINSFVKRVEDILISVIALVILAVPMLAVAIGVRLTSQGPALYKQVRYGLGAKPISVWKFRSMIVAENSTEFVQARKNDARVTRFGGFLRRTSLDELPQLFNVFFGDMSIVGPRPHPVALNEQFRGQIIGYMQRHKVKPGITGLAQIRGYRGRTETKEKMEHRIRYDIEYINNWTIWLDLVILIKTPWSLIGDDNAY